MLVQTSAKYSLVEGIDQAFACVAPAEPFLFTDQQTMSYGTLLDRMARLNGLFKTLELQPGNRAVIVSANDETAIELFFALLRAGITTIIGDGKATVDELMGLVDTADPAVVFADEHLINEARSRLPLPSTHLFSICTQSTDSLTADCATRSYPAILETLEPMTAFPDVPEDTLALIVFTSGTTSRPKGVCLSHANLYAQLEIFRKVYGFDGHTRLLNVLPLHHVDGLIRGPLAALYFGAQVHRPFQFSVEKLNALLETVSTHRITHFITVPAMLALINRLVDPDKHLLQCPDFRFVICSADHLDTNLWQNFETRFGVMVINAYGLSEVVCDALFSGSHSGRQFTGTLGKPAGCKAKILDQAGTELTNGETGELALRGPTVMQGYFLEPEETAKVVKEGWFYTGDLVRRDQHGVYHFEGRKKNVVISGGTTIYPESVTSSLLTMPGVTDAITFGVKDATWGQRLVSCVVPGDVSSIGKTDVIDHCRSHLAPEKVPAEVYFLEALPRGASGKVILEELQAIVADRETSNIHVNDVLAIAAECFTVPVEKLSLESSPYNTEGWDSLAHVTFITRLEEHCGISMSAEDIVQLTTLADAHSIVARLGN